MIYFSSSPQIRVEYKPTVIAFLALTSLGIVYFVYKIIIFKVGEQYTTGKYKNVGTVMLIQTAIYCAISYAVTLAVAILVFFNFGKGLDNFRTLSHSLHSFFIFLKRTLSVILPFSSSQ